MKLCPTCQHCYEDAEISCPHDQARLDHECSGGRLIAQKYSIDRLLYRGDFDSVFAGTNVETHQPVAIKLLLHKFAADAEVLKRLRREALAVAHLNTRISHQNVIKTYAYGTMPDGSAYIVMGFLSGQTLREHLDNAGPLPLLDAVTIARQVADGLEAAHRCGVVHCNLQPSNIILTRDYYGRPEIKITDFGFAKLWQQPLLSNSTLIPNGLRADMPYYMSPEFRAGDGPDNRSDIYSLGVVLYEMLAGIRPFDAAITPAVNLDHTEEPQPLSNFRADVPELLEKLVLQSLHEKPSLRPPTAADFAYRLRINAQNLPAERPPAVPNPDAVIPTPSGASPASTPPVGPNGNPSPAHTAVPDLLSQDYDSETVHASFLSFQSSDLKAEELETSSNDVANTGSHTTESKTFKLSVPHPDPEASQLARKSSIEIPAEGVPNDVNEAPIHHYPAFIYAGFATLTLVFMIVVYFWFAFRDTTPSQLPASPVAQASISSTDSHPAEQQATSDPVQGIESVVTTEADSSLPPEVTSSPPVKGEHTPQAAAENQKKKTPPRSSDATDTSSLATRVPSASTVKSPSGSTSASSPTVTTLSSERKTSREGDCPISVSENTLKIRSNGGSATLSISHNGSIDSAAITANNPNWSDILVFPEQRSAKNSGEVRYSVTSTSKKSGTYTVTFNSPCGPKTVTVRVE